jgi:hypothetical protein
MKSKTKKKAKKLNPQQRKLMESAGFKAVMDTFDPTKLYGHEFDIVYWKRGDIMIVFSVDVKVDVKTLVDRVVQQTYYRSVNYVREQAFKDISAKECALNYKNA